jgi:hypothetical protein
VQPDPEFLAWEYEIVARSEPIWLAHIQPLIRSADSLWQRAETAAQIVRSIQETDEQYPLTAAASYEGEALEAMRDQGLGRVALLLLGFAIEGLAKTLIVRKAGDATVVDGRFQHTGHDLLALLAEAGVDTTSEERPHLLVVRDYLEWLGRYPVPRAATGASGPRSASGAWVAARLGDQALTWSVARAVLDRAIKEQQRIYFAPELRNGG